MVSVVIAAYNGEKYIAEQINSVLPQLGENDELIVSDDNPEGETVKIVAEIAKNDGRVKYIRGYGKGVIKNFENAIKHAKGDYIFLCDQDDVWLDGKVDAVMKAFADGADVVMHDGYIADSNLNKTGQTVFHVNNAGKGILKNFIKNTYQGSCMAFSAEMKKYILPFPEKIPMHDQWIGIMGEKHAKVQLLNCPYILYRRHDETVTGSQTSAMQKIRWRIALLGCLIGK